MSDKVRVGYYAKITRGDFPFSSNIYIVTSITSFNRITNIEIKNVDDPNDIKIIIFDVTGEIKIEGLEGSHQLTFESNISKLQGGRMSQGGRTSREIGTGSQKFAMTGIEPIDLNILLQMEDRDLTSACEVDRYISVLCRNDMLWKQRILKYYPEAEQFKDDTTTSWRNYYKRIRDADSNPNSINDAVENGHVDVLQWLTSIKQEPIKADIWSVYNAALNGHLKVLQFLASLDPPILTNEDSANNAALNGHLDILQWFESLDPPILPDVYGANDAAYNGHLNVLKYLASLNPPILPDRDGANLAANHGKLSVLKYLASLNPPVLPDEYGAYDAKENGHSDVVSWLASLNPSIYPASNDDRPSYTTGN